MKKRASSDGNNRANSIHASLRQLLALGLSKSSSAEPQKITRTVKVKIQRKKGLELNETDRELHQTLTRHFNAVEKFRQSVLDELPLLFSEGGCL